MQVMMLRTTGGQETLQAKAHALRPARIVRDELRHFTGTTFPGDPYEGCARTLRLLQLVTASQTVTPHSGLMCWPIMATFFTKCP
jgi:hypothetical protein